MDPKCKQWVEGNPDTQQNPCRRAGGAPAPRCVAGRDEEKGRRQAGEGNRKTCGQGGTRNDRPQALRGCSTEVEAGWVAVTAWPECCAPHPMPDVVSTGAGLTTPGVRGWREGRCLQVNKGHKGAQCVGRGGAAPPEGEAAMAPISMPRPGLGAWAAADQAYQGQEDCRTWVWIGGRSKLDLASSHATQHLTHNTHRA